MNEQGKGQEMIVAITGASGAKYGVRMIECLLQMKYKVHVIVSNAGWRVLQEELNWTTDHRKETLHHYFSANKQHLIYHPITNIGASIASGSYQVKGMVIIPCSMGTLGCIAHGISTNLMTRAADVMIKEGRPLVLVPRETPLHAIHLENMLTLSRLQVKLVAAMPAFYCNPSGLDDIVNFIVGKVLDGLHIHHDLFPRWGDTNE